MNINLDNYESFFLLYVDNELSATAQKEMEEFLRAYPYLHSELDQLKETVLPVQKSSFGFKAELLKPVVSEEMIQENMLMYLDNELLGDHKKGFEELLLKEGELQKEWTLLKKTRLDAGELVSFPDKTILYHRERGRVVIGRFMRLAVAALFMGAGFFVGTRFFNQQSISTEQLADNRTVKSVGADPTTKAIPNHPGKINPAATTTTGDEPAGIRIASPVSPAQKVQTRTEMVRESAEQNVAIARVKQLDPTPVFVNDNEQGLATAPNHNIARLSQPVNEINYSDLIVSNEKHRPAALTDINMQPEENIFAQNALANMDENNDDDHIFMINEDKVSRTKAAGFLKRIKRTVERTTKIKPGNSLRIAGFEFAVK